MGPPYIIAFYWQWPSSWEAAIPGEPGCSFSAPSLERVEAMAVAHVAEEFGGVPLVWVRAWPHPKPSPATPTPEEPQR